MGMWRELVFIVALAMLAGTKALLNSRIHYNYARKYSNKAQYASRSLVRPTLVMLSGNTAPFTSRIFRNVVSQYSHSAQYSNSALRARRSLVRPSLDDIDRISRGQAAKRRGTGSRAVPHRLNEKERTEFDLAKKRKYVSLRGTGYRDKRGDSPLANIWRNYCDAVNQPCISIRRGIFIEERDEGNVLGDEVIVDFSPLRLDDVSEEKNRVLGVLEQNKYGSFQKVVDTSDLRSFGFDEGELPNLEQDVIWRLPVYSVSATFLEREDSKAFAETVAEFAMSGIKV